MNLVVYIALPLLLLLTILQATVFPHFPIFGLVPQVPFLVSLAWGEVRGLDEGLTWAFVAGFCLDLFSIMPVGFTSLLYIIAILSVSWMVKTFPDSRFFLPMIQAGTATLVVLLLQTVLSVWFLRDTGLTLAQAMQTAVDLSPTILLHTFLVLPIYWGLLTLNRFLEQPRWRRRS